MTNVVSHAGFDIVSGHARSVASLQLNRTSGAKVGVVPENWYGTVEHIRSTWSTYELGVEPLTCPRLSRVVLVLTLSMASKEGHPAYRSQSDNPLQGTTLGGSPDDPRRQRTRNAPAGHAARAGTRQRQRGLPGAGDLAHPVLPVAPALRALWRRRRASATAAGAPWTPGAGPSRGRAAGAQRGHQLGDLGLRADRGVPHAQLAAERGSKYGAAGLAA